MSKIKCFTKNHEEFDTYRVGICKIAKCTKCGSIGIIKYKVKDSSFVEYKVDWLSKKELKNFLDDFNDTIMAKAIKSVYNSYAVKEI
jgi:hypothetical protein